MKFLSLCASFILFPLSGLADTQNATIAGIIDSHILPRFETLAISTQQLADVAQADCDPHSDTLRVTFGTAFDAWVSASHLRFGPTETNDRAFALAFWPDSRGATPKALTTLLADQDPIATSVEDYAKVSIAARGFYAMEYMLYDDALVATGDPGHQCQLVQTISADIAATSKSILGDWQKTFAAKMQNPSPDGLYRDDEEVLQEMFKSLSTGLQFTSETRLGRPLGTFDRPRPTRAEVRRSGRSSLHVVLSLTSLHNLAIQLAGNNDELRARLGQSFNRSLLLLSELDDPTFASVAEPQSRLKIEIIQQSIEDIQSLVRKELGPTLGVTSGFNSLDGD